MKKPILFILSVFLAGAVTRGHATFSRVEQMGKSDDFFQDDISIFYNPATITRYANFLTGELGQLDETWTADRSDPREQWFGGAATIDLKNRSSLAVGFAVNREDELVSLLREYGERNYIVLFSDPLVIDSWVLPADTVRLSYLRNENPDYFYTTAQALGFPLDTVERDTFTKEIIVPRGRAELFLGWSDGAGLNVGGHLYVARQDSGLNEDPAGRAESHVYRGDFGIDLALGGHRLEASLGFADVGFTSIAPNDCTEVLKVFQNPESDISIFTAVRFFCDMPSLGGTLVPIFKYSSAKVNVFSRRSLTAGVGYSRELDRGLFYAGLAALFTNSIDSSLASDPAQRAAVGRYTEEVEAGSLRFNFGIEHNIAWDWFAVRVGGRKVLTSLKTTKNYSVSGLAPATEERMEENPDDDGTDADVIGFGVGFSFGGTLKVDGTVVEPFVYKNPFSWSAKRLMVSRISATYSF